MEAVRIWVLFEYGICNGSTIHCIDSIVGSEKRVFLMSPEKKASIWVTDSDTIRKIKQKIENAFGVPVKQQQLMCNGKEDLLDYDWEKMHNDTCINIKAADPIHISIETQSGSIFSLKVFPGYTIMFVKQIVASTENINQRYQSLVYRDKELDDDAKTLEECNVREGSSIIWKIKRN